MNYLINVGRIYGEYIVINNKMGIILNIGDGRDWSQLGESKI